MSSFVRTLILALGLVLLAAPAGAAPPAAATLSTATGTQALSFTWNVVAGATWYYLWVNDDDAAPKFTRWYTADEAGCAGGGATLCSVTVALNWRPGAGRWWIRTNNADGNGPWSAAQNFTIPLERPVRLFDSSVPAKELGILIERFIAVRLINGVALAFELRPDGVRFENNLSFYYLSNDCTGTPHVNGAFFPRRLFFMGPSPNLANSYVTNNDYGNKAFQSYRENLNGVPQVACNATGASTGLSLTLMDVTSTFSGVTSPLIILP